MVVAITKAGMNPKSRESSVVALTGKYVALSGEWQKIWTLYTTISSRNIKNLMHVDDTTLLVENSEDLKWLQMKVEAEIAKAELQLNIKKTKVMTTEELRTVKADDEEIEII